MIGRIPIVATWVTVMVAISVAVARPGKGGKLYPTFAAAGEHFRNAEPLYGPVPDGQDQYRYSPLVAATLVPWSYWPGPIGGIVFRWVQAMAFFVALRWWAKIVVPDVPWPALAMLTLPLVAGNFFNAQLNPLVGALLLAGLAAFERGRWNGAAVAVAVAAAIKVYPLSVGLLLGVLEPRRFAPRLLVAIGVAACLPFVFQPSDYVFDQFTAWEARVAGDDRTEQPMERGYHDFQKLMRRWGWPTNLTAYRGMEAMAGGLAASLVLFGKRRGWNERERVVAVGALGLIWCTLFGPATESATYMLLAPIAAWAVLTARGRGERAAVGLAYGLLASVVVVQWFPRPISDPYRALIPQAHAAVILLGWFVWRMP